jgi:argininosuccinate lyase
MQEDKVPLFHAADTVTDCLSIFTSLLGAASFRGERMRSEAEQGFLNATDLADFLVRKGMPFRRAHRVAGEAVGTCLETGMRLEEMTAEQWAAVSTDVDPAVREALGLETVVEARAASGGTAKKQVLRQIRLCQKELEKRKGKLAKDLERASVASALV